MIKQATSFGNISSFEIRICSFHIQSKLDLIYITLHLLSSVKTGAKIPVPRKAKAVGLYGIIQMQHGPPAKIWRQNMPSDALSKSTGHPSLDVLCAKKRYRASRSHLTNVEPTWICLYCTSAGQHVHISLENRVIYHSMCRLQPLSKYFCLLFCKRRTTALSGSVTCHESSRFEDSA